MMSSMIRQDVLAANLANVNTVGYKPDRAYNETFSSLFLQNLGTGRDVGSMTLGTRVSGTVTDFTQGALRATGNQLDLAIGGEGFFAVQTAEGVRFTRNGQLTRSADGYLTDQGGNFVLGSDGQRILLGAGDPTINSEGRIFSSSNASIGRIGIFTLDLTTAKKVGANQWSGTATGSMPADTQVRQGFVEASGTNSVREMIEMISTLRSYESAQRVISSIDSTLEKATNQVGSVQ